MVGKASLLLVMGFSLIFLIFGHNFNNISTRTVDNLTDYYTETVSHDLAVSGANLAANAIFFNNNWTAGYDNLHLNGGEIDVDVIVDAGENTRTIISEATYNGVTSTVEVVLSPSRFSKYAYYSESEGTDIWWMARDSVFGPFHTQDNLRVDNHPVFGIVGYRTTIKGKIIYRDNKSSDKPIFHGSFEAGVNDTLPSNGLQPLRDAAQDDGFKINLSSRDTTIAKWNCTHYYPKHTSPCNSGYMTYTTSTILDTVYITFATDSVKIKMGYNKPTTTYKTSNIAPNGVIYVEGMDIRLKGTVEGQYSVVGDKTIWLDDDIIYSKDPRIYPSSTDLLGIISQNDVMINDDGGSNNPVQNIKIHGAIYCEDGGFGAENYKTRDEDGYINLLGGVTQKTRKGVGQFSGSEVTQGFAKKYRYDDRLMKLFPPFFPTSDGFQIVSWKE